MTLPNVYNYQKNRKMKESHKITTFILKFLHKMTARLNRRLKTLDRDDVYFNSSEMGLT